MKRTFRGFNIRKCKFYLAQCRWEELVECADVHEMTEKYERFLEQVLNAHAPVRKIKIRSNYKFALSNESKEKMRERDKVRHLATKAKGTEKVVLFQKYRCLRNTCNRLVRRDTKRALASKLTENTRSEDILWKEIKNITNPRAETTFKLIENGKAITNESEIANIFNDFFIEKVRKLRTGIPENIKDDPCRKIRDRIGTNSARTFPFGRYRKVRYPKQWPN